MPPPYYAYYGDNVACVIWSSGEHFLKDNHTDCKNLTCFPHFSNHPCIYRKKGYDMRKYKRVSRHPSEVTKARLSGVMKGRSLDPSTRKKIADSLRAYWRDDRNFPADADERDKM